MNLKVTVSFLFSAFLMSGCASIQNDKNSIASVQPYCDDSDVLIAYFVPKSYVHVNSAVQKALLSNGFYPVAGTGKFKPMQAKQNVVGWLSIRENEGVEISLDGTAQNSIRAPHSLEFQTQTICSESLDQAHLDGTRQTIKKIAEDVIKDLYTSNIRAVPEMKNEKSIEHAMRLEMPHVRAVLTAD